MRRNTFSLSGSIQYFCFLTALWVTASACNYGDRNLQAKTKADSTISISYDTIPEVRRTVSSKPVDSYYVTVGDPKLDRKFGVSIYETAATFQFIMRMQYEAMLITDTLSIPNFGIWPVVQVHPGHDKLSCIIGFLDKKKAFKEYKMVTAQGDKLKLVVLKRYSVGKYRTVYKTGQGVN